MAFRSSRRCTGLTFGYCWSSSIRVWARTANTQIRMNLVANHYRSIALPADQVARISSYLKEALSDRREEAEAAEGQITLRIQRLNHERTKLLQLHYADAVPIELFKSEQERITRELENARHGLASVSLEFDQIEQNMMRALELSRDCHSAHVAAPERVRRHFNQAFFEKIYVRDDGEVRHDLAEHPGDPVDSGEEG